MKKILRLVTTSVLTLTLVACGGNSSSSQSTSTSASTSTGSQSTSTTSSYAAVSSITLSAAAETLEQVSTSLQKVTVSATLNSGVNPAQELEWYVNGTKSSQTGKSFEYTPTAVGEYAIVAKVSSVSSNTVTLKVSAPGLEIESVKVVSSKSLEIKGPEGSSIAIEGKTIVDSSYYDLVNKKYIITLKEAVAQGDTLKITLSKDGASKTTSYTYDTRLIEAAITGATANADGSYTIVKPYAAAGETAKTYTLSAESTDIIGTNLKYTVSTSVPEGATAIQDKTALYSPTTASYDGFAAQSFTVSSTTIVGDYKHTISFGVKTDEVIVHVVDPQTKLVVDSISQTVDDLTTIAVEKFAMKYQYDANKDGDILDDDDVKGIVANEDGSYTVVKPYETSGVSNKVSFEFKGSYFTKDPYVANQYSVELIGPSLYGGENANLMTGIETTTTGTASTANSTNMTSVQYKSFEATNANGTGLTAAIAQDITANTPAGTYTFTITATTAAGDEYTSNLVLKVVEPEASISGKLQSVVESTDGTTQSTTGRVAEYSYDADSKTYTFAKPLGTDSYLYNFGFILNNLESLKATSDDVVADQTALYTYSDFQGSVFTLAGLEAAKTAAAVYKGTYSSIANYDNAIYVVYDGGYYKASSAITRTAYSTTATSYALGALVTQGGKLYKCITAITTTAGDFDPQKWEEVSSPADAGFALVTVAGDATLAKALAYIAENITVYGPTTGATQLVFAKYSYTVSSPSVGTASTSGKLAISLAANDDDLLVLNYGYAWAATHVAPVTYDAATSGLIAVTSSTVTGTYSYTMSVEIGGVTYTDTVNVKIEDPAAKVFVLSGKNVTTSTGVATSTGGAGYQCIEVNGVAHCAVDGIYDIDSSEVDGTDTLTATIGIADLAIGTHSYSVSKEYPDATKNISTSGQIKVVAANILANGYIDTANVTDLQTGALAFKDAWKINETSVVEKGTYKFTFTIDGVSKEIIINVGDFNDKLVVESVSVEGTKLGTFGANYIYNAPDVTPAVAVNGIIELSSVNFEEGTDLWVSIGAAALADGTLKTNAGLTKVVFDSDGIFKYNVEIADATAAAAFNANDKQTAITINYYVYKTSSTNDGQVVNVAGAGDSIVINAINLNDGKVATH